LTEKNGIPAVLQTESGLADDFDFHITGASFGFREKYNNGETPLLLLQGTSPDVDLPDDYELRISCGNGWEIKDNGKRIVKPGRAGARLNDSSKYGAFVSAIAQMHSKNPAVAEWVSWLTKNSLSVTEANIWVGVGVHMNRVKKDYGGEIGEKEIMMPTACLGVKAAKAATKATAPAKAAPEPQAEAQEETQADTGATPEGSPVLVKKLTLLAKKLKDRDAFQTDAMDIAELNLKDNEALMASVLDDGPSGFYASVMG